MRRKMFSGIGLVILILIMGIFTNISSAQQEPYIIFSEVEENVTLYSYDDSTVISVYDSVDNWLLDLELEVGIPQTISLDPGTYKFMSISKFSYLCSS